MIVYKIENKINHKIYIGQTIHSLEKRKKMHLLQIKDGNKIVCEPLRNDFIKYGLDNFDWKIIDTATSIQELYEKESYWIEYYESTNENLGYNQKGGASNPYLTDRVKKKIGDAQRGELNHMYGRLGKDNPCSIPVLDVTTGIRYDGASECARQLDGFNVSKICSVCRGDRYTYKGHVFRYLNKDGSIRDNGKPSDINVIKKAKLMLSKFCRQGQYNTIQSCAKFLEKSN